MNQQWVECPVVTLLLVGWRSHSTSWKEFRPLVTPWGYDPMMTYGMPNVMGGMGGMYWGAPITCTEVQGIQGMQTVQGMQDGGPTIGVGGALGSTSTAWGTYRFP